MSCSNGRTGLRRDPWPRYVEISVCDCNIRIALILLIFESKLRLACNAGYLGRNRSYLRYPPVDELPSPLPTIFNGSYTSTITLHVASDRASSSARSFHLVYGLLPVQLPGPREERPGAASKRFDAPRGKGRGRWDNLGWDCWIAQRSNFQVSLELALSLGLTLSK